MMRKEKNTYDTLFSTEWAISIRILAALATQAKVRARAASSSELNSAVIFYKVSRDGKMDREAAIVDAALAR